MPNSHKCFKKQPVRHSKLPWTHFLIEHLKKENESVRHQPIAISMVKVIFINMFTRMAMMNVTLTQ